MTSMGSRSLGRVTGIVMAATALVPVALAVTGRAAVVPDDPAGAQASGRPSPGPGGAHAQSVAGQQLTIESRKETGSFAGTDPAAIQSLVDGLAARGKTVAVLSVVAYAAVRHRRRGCARPGADAGARRTAAGRGSPEAQFEQVPGVVAGGPMR